MNKPFTSFLGVTAATLALALGGCAEDTDAATANAASATAAQTVAAAAASVLDFGTTPAGQYAVEKDHAYITFTYDHQGYSHPYLRFRSFDGTLDLDPADLSKSRVNVTIDISSIDSGVDVFDGHLRGDGFFDVENHPTATFSSTSFDANAKGGTMTGDLTMRGITKPVTLDVTFNKAGENFRSKVPQVGFSARGKIMRSDWDLGKYAPAVGDAVTLIIEAEFEKTE